MFPLLHGRARRAVRFFALRSLYLSFAKERTPEGRARKLLREWLTPLQREQLDTHGHFDVIGGSSGKRYRIANGYCANILELDESGKPVAGLCFVPVGDLAMGDVMLTQKAALETREAVALAVANKFPPRPPTGQYPAQRPF